MWDGLSSLKWKYLPKIIPHISSNLFHKKTSKFCDFKIMNYFSSKDTKKMCKSYDINEKKYFLKEIRQGKLRYNNFRWNLK